MRTRETIEAQSATKPSKKAEKPRSQYGRGENPNSLKNLMAPWQPGHAPKSPGRPKLDVAQLIVRKAFEDNQELIYNACVAQLAKGGAFAFQVYSDRAFGKLKETRDTGSEYNDVPDGDLQVEIDKILGKLGLAREIRVAAEAGVATARAEKANGAAKDSDLLPR